MPLPVTEVERELTHTRRVRYEGYKRADGLWDLEAHLTDIKNHDYQLKTGVRRAGQPVHNMWVRVTIDRTFSILDACASSDAVPYEGGCETIAPAYRKLIGLNLLKGFRKNVHELLGGVRGCTHVTEMLGGLPTAAIQTRRSGAGAPSCRSSTSTIRSTPRPKPIPGVGRPPSSSAIAERKASTASGLPRTAAAQDQ